MRDYLFIAIIAAAVTYLLTPLVRKFAVLINAQHAPRSRDVHTEPTPLIGGLAMYFGMAAALLVAERLTYLEGAFPSTRVVNGLLVAGLLLVIMGIVDDRFGMSALQKAAGQVAAGGILAWSGVALPWLPLPGGESFVLEPDLSYTLTILLIVVTINAVNFIDGLDGLAAGVVGIAGLSFFIYSYTLTNSIHVQTESVPAVVSAVLVGMCAGFLPHNFHPARIFMGDTGAMLIGLLLAYAPISSTVSLDPGVLVNHSGGQDPLNRFPTILPILLPIAILVIPYADLFLAVIRRTARGESPFAPDREHLHHRLQNMGHSHRQSVLLMYLWAALFSGAVVGLSVVRTGLVWLGIVTLAALVALLLATVPQLRPWHARAAATSPVPDGAALAAGGAPASASVAPVPPAMARPPVSPGIPHRFPVDPPVRSYPAGNGFGPHGSNDPGAPTAPNGYGAPTAPNGYGAPTAPNGYGAPTAPNGYGAPAGPADETGEAAPPWTYRDYPASPGSTRR